MLSYVGVGREGDGGPNTKNTPPWWISSCSTRTIHANEFFIQLNTPKFPELVQSNLCRFGHKVMHMKIPESLHEDFCTLKPASSKRCFDFVPPKNNTQKLSHLPFFTISKYWNSLSSEVKQPQPLVGMKEKLKTHFINTYLALPTCKKKKCPSCLSSRPNFS